MNIELNHGIPQHNFFLIVQPKRSYDETREAVKTIVELKDPKTGETVKAEFHAHWDMTEKEFLMHSSFAKLSYGCSAYYLQKILLDKYPELKRDFKVEYWLLKKL